MMRNYRQNFGVRLVRRISFGVLVACTVAGLSAFRASVKDPVAIRSIIIEDNLGNAAFMHGNHWHGILNVPASADRKFTIYYVPATPNADSMAHTIPAREDWSTLPAKKKYDIVVTMQHPDIVEWKNEGVSGGILKARASEGATRLIFAITHKKKEIFKSAPIVSRIATQ